MSFSKGIQWGFMDLKGKEIMAPKYDFAESFNQNLSIVELKGFQGVIDITGKEIIPISFESVKKVGDKLIQVGLDNKYGLYTRDSKLIVSLKYEQIRQLSDELLILTNQNEIHYLYLSDYSLIVPKLN
jgi:hypothetical protein